MTENTWGMRFNQYPDHKRYKEDQKPQDCPAWLNPSQVNIWQGEGLIVWNSIDKKIERQNGNEALRLLNDLISQENWKSEGVSITHLVSEFEMEVPPQGRRKKETPESKPDVKSSAKEPYYKEVLHLPPEAGPKLIELIESNKSIILKMADGEKQRFNRALMEFHDMAFKLHHEKEQSEFDFASRSLKWERVDESKWSCQYEQADGRIFLEKNKPRLFWHTCVQRQRFAGKSGRFLEFKEAVEWVEKEIVDLANQPAQAGWQSQIRSDQQIEADRIRLTKKLLNGPYWIDAQVLEPKKITYQVMIELEANPIASKTYESDCGDVIHYDKRYPTPSKLAVTLGFDIGQFKMEQPIGENSDWYQIFSLTTYYQETAALQQAQKVWDQSQILQQFKAGQISRARYGYREVETKYTVYLGACENPEKLWEQPIDRKEYMELEALRESLCFALDLNDYRDYLGISVGLMSDDQVLAGMHAARTRSKYLPEEIRRESKVWLAQHEPLT